MRMAGCITTEINIDNYWKIYTSIQIQRERIMGKYIHLFQTKEEFNQAVEDKYTEPWVSYTKGEDKLDYNMPEERMRRTPFTIEATQGGTTIYFRQSLYAANDGLDPLKVEVSADNGETWAEVTAAPAEDDVPGAILVELDKGEKVLIRGRNEAYGYFNTNDSDGMENCNFYADKPCYVYGNIMSLIGDDNFARLQKVKEYAFACFFSDYDEVLDWSWVLSKEGEELLLPATTLANSCYKYMFFGCTGLTVAPELPATTLVNSCYGNMFRDCTGLTSAPELPATTLTESCYSNMFQGCSNLAYIKAMFTTTPGSSYTTIWVRGVKATGTFIKNSAATWNETGDNGVPSGWTVETASE